VRNKEMTKILADVLGRPVFMPAVPGFVLKMMMGEFGSVLLEGQKVMPKKLMEAGFQFQYSQIQEALEDLVAN
jgi:NAD dependent epimerase/dehydratase family enzyme